MTRPDWEDTWLEVARVIAKRSLCSRDQVGAVIVSKTERIVSSGYNGPPAGFQHNYLPCTNWCPRSRGDNTVWISDPEYIGPMVDIEFRNDMAFASVRDSFDKKTWPLLTDDDWHAVGFKKAVELAKDYADCPALHAEANALSVCERTVREGGTIYVTSHMCMNCAKLVANSGLETVVVSPNADHTHRNSSASYDFLEKCGLTVIIK